MMDKFGESIVALSLSSFRKTSIMRLHSRKLLDGHLK